MLKFLNKTVKKKWLPLTWTILTIVLLCLPGSTLPGGGLFNIPQLDKVAHIILFGGLVLLWMLHLQNNGASSALILLLIIIIFSIGLGIILEFVQMNFIPHRSFDQGDIIADVAGSLSAGLLTYFYVRKRK